MRLASDRRRAARSVALLVLGLALAGPARAAVVSHPLAGNARFQIVNGLPIPITAAPLPQGRVLAVPGATVMQTNGASPRQLTFDPGQLTAPGNPVTLQVFIGPAVFQQHTAISVQWPAGPAMLRAGGRTGPATVSFCPGQTLTLSNGLNPACASPAIGAPVPGLMRYTRTANQFGGPAAAAVGGTANAALRVAASPPCAYASGANPQCQVIFARAMVGLAAGDAFGASRLVSNAAASPGRFYVTANAAGLIVAITPTGLGPGLANPLTSVAGPWTTGRVSITTAAGLVFILSGSDGRVGGVGSLSLVAGGVASSALSGPHAMRGWLNLDIQPALPTVPALVPWAGALLAVALSAGGGLAARRRAARIRARSFPPLRSGD